MEKLRVFGLVLCVVSFMIQSTLAASTHVTSSQEFNNALSAGYNEIILDNDIDFTGYDIYTPYNDLTITTNGYNLKGGGFYRI